MKQIFLFSLIGFFTLSFSQKDSVLCYSINSDSIFRSFKTQEKDSVKIIRKKRIELPHTVEYLDLDEGIVEIYRNYYDSILVFHLYIKKTNKYYTFYRNRGLVNVSKTSRRIDLAPQLVSDLPFIKDTIIDSTNLYLYELQAPYGLMGELGFIDSISTSEIAPRNLIGCSPLSIVISGLPQTPYYICFSSILTLILEKKIYSEELIQASKILLKKAKTPVAKEFLLKIE